MTRDKTEIALGIVCALALLMITGGAGFKLGRVSAKHADSACCCQAEKKCENGEGGCCSKCLCGCRTIKK